MTSVLCEGCREEGKVRGLSWPPGAGDGRRRKVGVRNERRFQESPGPHVISFHSGLSLSSLRTEQECEQISFFRSEDPKDPFEVPPWGEHPGLLAPGPVASASSWRRMLRSSPVAMSCSLHTQPHPAGPATPTSELPAQAQLSHGGLHPLHPPRKTPPPFTAPQLATHSQHLSSYLTRTSCQSSFHRSSLITSLFLRTLLRDTATHPCDLIKPWV